MYTEGRKLHIIDEVLKLNSDAALAKLESVVEKLKEETPKTGFKDFAGIWTKKEAEEIELAIKNSCENINPEDWK
ncbi:hypothetical protein EWM62_15950 [Mucilaginibacter terrigena]|uniref:Uncharacterized protein n=1 Tax=Mucilaginibacter terrigena TaxID=2492395 RepID=A0A4Q5LK32_9SPHI|nr:hypothetical protein [Mucilaginibacter terrigena]RYU87982.1 hypothetical protein EWM62_15950 [Mucilaginibacter terrigena]